MADPVINGLMKAMWIWKGKSGLPEDRFINNWYFEANEFGVFDDHAGAIQRVLEAFYLTSGTAGAVTSYLNTGAFSGAELRVYHLGDQPPREPIIKIPTWTPPASAASPVPLESAVCLSFRSDLKGPRGRGRLYIGPISSSAIALVNSVPVVAPGFRDCLKDRALNVMGTTENVDWVQLSKMEGAARNVTGGWVDDAIDTVRRRGPRPKARTIFGDAYVLAA